MVFLNGGPAWDKLHAEYAGGKFDTLAVTVTVKKWFEIPPGTVLVIVFKTSCSEVATIVVVLSIVEVSVKVVMPSPAASEDAATVSVTRYLSFKLRATTIESSCGTRAYVMIGTMNIIGSIMPTPRTSPRVAQVKCRRQDEIGPGMTIDVCWVSGFGSYAGGAAEGVSLSLRSRLSSIGLML